MSVQACNHPVEHRSVDPARGQTSCTVCGNIIDTAQYEMDPNFGGSAGGGTRGAATGGAGNRLGNQCRPARARDPQHGSHGASRPSNESARRQIGSLGKKMSLPALVIDDANKLYRQAVNANAIVGARFTVLCACLYLACRQHRLPQTVLDFADEAKDPPWTILNYVRIICRVTSTVIPPADASFYVARFTDQLDLKEQTSDVTLYALKVLRAMKDDWITTGRRPLGICAAAVLVACRAFGIERNMEDFARMSRLKLSTIVFHIEEFAATPAAEAESIDDYQPSNETVPASFRVGRAHDEQKRDTLSKTHLETDFYTLIDQARTGAPVTPERMALWRRFVIGRAKGERQRAEQKAKLEASKKKKREKKEKEKEKVEKEKKKKKEDKEKKKDADDGAAKDDDAAEDESKKSDDDNDVDGDGAATGGQDQNVDANADGDHDETKGIDPDILDVRKLSPRQQLEILGVPVRSERSRSVVSSDAAALPPMTTAGNNMQVDPRLVQEAEKLALGLEMALSERPLGFDDSSAATGMGNFPAATQLQHPQSQSQSQSQPHQPSTATLDDFQQRGVSPSPSAHPPPSQHLNLTQFLGATPDQTGGTNNNTGRRTRGLTLQVSDGDTDTEEYIVTDNEECIRNEKALKTVLQAKFTELQDAYAKSVEVLDARRQMAEDELNDLRQTGGHHHHHHHHAGGGDAGSRRSRADSSQQQMEPPGSAAEAVGRELRKRGGSQIDVQALGTLFQQEAGGGDFDDMLLDDINNQNDFGLGGDDFAL